MTNLIDQYEQASQRYPGRLPGPIRPEMSTTGFINIKMEKEVPIFSRQRVNYDPPHPLTHLVVCNNQLVLALGNKVLRRFDIKNPNAAEDIDISKYAYQAKISNLFLDPTGQHLLIAIKPRAQDGQPELLYLSHKAQKPKQANKFKGHHVTAVGWTQNNTSEAVTAPILLGTTKGLIFETEIGADDRFFQSSLEQYWRQLPSYLPLYGARELDGLVFDVGKGTDMPITALEFHRVAESDRYFILATTATRLYQFVGYVPGTEERPLLQHIFNNYLTIPERFLEIPGTLDYSVLQFYYPSPRTAPETFAWLTGAGVLFGRVDPMGQGGSQQITVDTELLIYPPLGGGGEGEEEKGRAQEETKPPLGLVLTQFHVLLLHPNCVQGLCTLSGDVVFQDPFRPEMGTLVGIVKDPIFSTIWVFSQQSIFKYKVVDESRNMWQVFMEKGEFEVAKQYCGNNQAHLNSVVVRQAEYFFQNKEYQLSARHYAQTEASFEETALKFLRADKPDALKTFLCKKLENLKHHEKTQSTMIILWVVELYLNELGVLRDSGKRDLEEYRALEEDFLRFLNTPQIKGSVENIQGTLYKLLASHGDKDNLIHCTILLEDYERVIHHHIQNNGFLAALDVLQKQSNTELFYKFIPTLIQTVPRETVDTLILQGKRLQPCKLIPAFVLCDQIQNLTLGKEIMRYLEYCVCKLDSREESIHNYLLSLYTTTKSEKLLSYLESQGNEVSAVSYNPQYALRLCLDQRLDKACIHLYTLLHMYEEAVDLALKVSVDLAKQTASLPDEEDEELSKKLWLKIARHVVKEKNDIQQAMAFLQQCDLIKIEDVLPFFPDFITIDHFKDAICASLQEYNQHIQDLKEEMDEATKSAEGIRQEIQSFRNRHTVVRGQDKCYVCNYPLLSRGFYVFPCGHRFHSDCLVAELSPHLTPARKKRLADLQQQLASMVGKEETASQSSMLMSTREQLKADLDDMVASECLYCGDLMIRCIDMPFINDFERVLKEWE